MTDIASVADVHLGNHKRHGGPVLASMNARCREAVSVLAAAADKAIAAGARVFLVAGDLFDYDRPEAALLRAVQDIFERLRAAGCEPVLLVGNHDQESNAPNDHALAPLAPVATIIDRPSVLHYGSFRLVCVPFQVGPAREWLPGVLAGLEVPEDDARNVLAVHLGIRDEKTAPWLSTASDAIDAEQLAALCLEHHIEYVYAGNWHDRRKWKFDHCTIMQLGALVPTGWDNPGLTGYGTLGLWRDGKGQHIVIPGPRFIKVRTQDELDAYLDQNKSLGCRLLVSEEAMPGDITTRAAYLQTLVSDGRLSTFEVLPDKAMARIEAAGAGARARSADSFDEAVEGYVRALPLDEGVNRDSVLERVKGYLQ